MVDVPRGIIVKCLYCGKVLPKWKHKYCSYGCGDLHRKQRGQDKQD